MIAKIRVSAKAEVITDDDLDLTGWNFDSSPPEKSPNEVTLLTRNKTHLYLAQSPGNTKQPGRASYTILFHWTILLCAFVFS